VSSRLTEQEIVGEFGSVFFTPDDLAAGEDKNELVLIEMAPSLFRVTQ
jgi:hypothetical protein